MVSETPHYALSQDYEHMLALLEEGPLVGFVDYEHGNTRRDPVRIKLIPDGNEYEYCVGVRDIGYFSSWGKDPKDEFVEQCRKYHLSYIVPNAESTNA